MTTRRRPREFCGECFPWPVISELSEGDEIVACYLVHDRRLSQTKHNKSFLDLRLGDRSGAIAGKVWEDAGRFDPLCGPDTFVGVHARVDLFRDQLQLRVSHLEALHVEHGDLEFFLPSSPRDQSEMCSELDAVIRSVRDRPLAALLRRCLGAAGVLGKAYRVHPAAKRNHHAYVGGLMEHSLSVAAICDRLATHYARHGARIDRDLLVAGALLHDLGKVRELAGGYSIAYTDAGQLLGHILLGIGMVTREAESVPGLSGERLLLLQHLIASHQGKPEWDSPRVPQMVEALILHYADDLDAKLNPTLRMLDGVAPGAWSEYDQSAGRKWFQPPDLSATPEVEAVPPAEAFGVVIDLFRG